MLAAIACLVPLLWAGPATAATGSTAILDAGGQRQWISCAGDGSPTVVIASGLRADHRMWRSVLGPLRERTRVCITDRPGLGSSPDRVGSTRTDAGEHAAELSAVLEAAGETGPFIVVGHSYAGLIARAFAVQHPDSVAGMLLLDAVYPGIHRTFLPSYASPWHEGGTTIDMAASERATRGLSLGDRPLIVIAAGDPKDATSWAARKWNREQARAARLSRAGRLWFARTSGHVIQRDQPTIVVKAVDALLAQTR